VIDAKSQAHESETHILRHRAVIDAKSQAHESETHILLHLAVIDGKSHADESEYIILLHLAMMHPTYSPSSCTHFCNHSIHSRKTAFKVSPGISDKITRI
jgi:hypothetical protein